MKKWPKMPFPIEKCLGKVKYRELRQALSKSVWEDAERRINNKKTKLLVENFIKSATKVK